MSWNAEHLLTLAEGADPAILPSEGREYIDPIVSDVGVTRSMT
jgi:hypothetical protein